MAQTVGQHGVAAFTSPVNGDPLNATVVVANDNTTRGAYVDHDSDPDIHVQSSLLAARPAAGTVGRKWMTTDSGAVKLWFDTGSAWSEIAYLPSAGGTVAGNVSITGTLGVTGVLTATGGVVGAVTGNASTATALQTARAINGVNFDGTAAITVTAAAGTLTGATLASNVLASSLTSVGTLAGLTVTAPITGSVTGSSGSTTGNAATATALQTGRAINGVTFDGTAPITVTAAAGTLSGATLASGVTASSLTSVGTLTGLTVTNPIVGSVTGSSGSTTGNAATATALQTARAINGTNFDGTAAITVTAAAGTLTGATLASNVLASSLTSVGTLAGLTVTAPITGSVTGSSGSTTGNAATATALQTARTINGTSFDGTANITVTAAAGTLTGATLASGVTASSLTSVGTLTSLAVSGGATFASTSGNVGIGTTSPTDTSGFGKVLDMQSVSGGQVIIRDSDDTTRYGRFAYDGTDNSTWVEATGTGSLIRFRTAGTQNMTLDASGNLGIGTTSPSTRLHVSAASNDPVLIKNTSGTAYNSLVLENDSGKKISIGVGGSAVGGSLQDATYVSAITNSPLLFATNNTERARIDSSGNVGIGVASPATKLQVSSSGSVTSRVTTTDGGGTNLDLTISSTEAQIGSPNGVSLALRTSGTTRALIDTSGNLGLAVTPSAWNASYNALEVGTGTCIANLASNQSSFVNNGFVAASGAWTYRNNGFASLFQQLSGQNLWYTAPSGTAGNAITFTQAMTLDASGRLGIGTATPGVVLDVRAATGQIRLTSDTGTSHVFGSYENTGGGLRVGVDSSTGGVLSSGTAAYSGVIATTGAQVLAFGTNATERARIDTSGSFLIGTTSSSFKLNVSATSGANRDVFIAGVTGASNGFMVQWNHSTLKTRVSITDIPTSASGLPAGTLYSDAGTIKIA